MWPIRKLADWFRAAIRIVRSWFWVAIRQPLSWWSAKYNKGAVFYVKGRYLYDNDHRKVILRGINLPLLDDWDFPGSDKLGELEKTGANAVRIQWYAQYPPPKKPTDPPRPPYTTSHLDAFLDKCRTSRLIPILELHDCTVKHDPDLVNTQLIPWWISPVVVAVLKRHRRYLIINLANELGAYRWQNSSATALNTFKVAYKQAINSIRNAGLGMPIMIDAPDGGTSINVFTSIGQELIDHDPEHNVLLSVHAYWGGYDGTAQVAATVNAKLPIVFGEIANKQFENEDECFYGLDGTNLNNPPPTGFRYQSLLALLAQYEIGWLAWAWFKDNCEHRRMTPDGNYTGAIDGSSTGLTPYGEDVLHNSTYGLRLGYFSAKRSQSLPGAPPS